MKKKSLNKDAESRGKESRGFFVHKRNFAQEIKRENSRKIKKKKYSEYKY